jgi:hypothetical protein
VFCHVPAFQEFLLFNPDFHPVNSVSLSAIALNIGYAWAGTTAFPSARSLKTLYGTLLAAAIRESPSSHPYPQLLINALVF